MRGLQQLDDYVKYVPGLSFATREPGGTTIVFRGVAPSGLQFGAVSSSGLYLDEQPITQSGRNPDPRLIDIERLEALRGPQGTLYGASSQSGTLRVITNKPDPAEFDAWVEGQVSTIEDGGTGYDVSAMVNIPLVAGPARAAARRLHAEDAGLHRQRACATARAWVRRPRDHGRTVRQLEPGRRGRQFDDDDRRARGAALGRHRRRRSSRSARCSRTSAPTVTATSTAASATSTRSASRTRASTTSGTSSR